MAKHFEPSEVLERNNKSFSVREVGETLRHYGFVLSGGGKHIGVKHREYPDLFNRLHKEGVGEVQSSDFLVTFNMTHSASGTCPPKAVRFAAAACLKVKELNAERRGGQHLYEIPGWVASQLGSIKDDDGATKFEQREEHNVLRLYREPEGDARRSYSIRCQKDDTGLFLTVKNLNFPDAHHFTFRLNEGDRNPQESFLFNFKQLDEAVKEHITQRERDYYQKLGELIANRGMTASRDDFETHSIALLHLTHEGAALDESVLRLPEGETVADESIELVNELLAKTEAFWQQQQEFLEGLQAQGWQVTDQTDHKTYSADDLEAIGRGTMQIENTHAITLAPPDERPAILLHACGENGLFNNPIEEVEALTNAPETQIASPVLRQPLGAMASASQTPAK